MDEENESMRTDDLESQMQQGGQVVQNAAQKAAQKGKDAVSDKAKDFAKNLLEKDKENKEKEQKKKIKSAKTLGKKAGEIAGRGPKIAGNAMQMAGLGLQGAGLGLKGTGKGIRAAGKGIDATGKGIQAAADALNATGYGAVVGAPLLAIGQGISAAGQGIDQAGAGVDKAGTELVKAGKNVKKQGEELVKQGEKIQKNVEKTVSQIGKMPKMPKIPNMPSNVKVPDKNKLIRDALAKVFAKQVLKKVLIAILPIIVIILIYMIITGSIRNRGSMKEGDNSNVPYVVSSTISNNLTIVPNDSGGFSYAFKDENGNYISLDQAIENALKTLEDNQSTSLNDLGKTEEIRKQTLKKLFIAEMKTQYPDLSNSGLSEGTTINTTASLSTADVAEIVENMTLDEKIYQLLFVGVKLNNGNDYADSLVGGFYFYGGSNYDANIGSMGSNSSVAPIIATDDEGGKIVRAATGYDSAQSYGTSQNYDKLYNDEVSKTKYLLGKGINMNLGPVSDVSSSGAMYDMKRSYSSNSDITKQCVKKVIEARKDANTNGVTLISSLKHYPGYGSNSANSDKATVKDNRSVEDINADIEVFKEGISAGAESVMVSNIVYSNLDSNNPASLSSKVIGGLRSNFSGVIMTDEIDATATASISDRYKKAIIAGNDMVLLNEANVNTAFNQIKNAVNNGEISEQRINESVERILHMKKNAGILKTSVTNNSENTENEENNEQNGENEANTNTTPEEENTSSNITSNDELQGGIKFQRKDTNGSVQELKYIDEATFNQLIVSGTDDCMNYYTLKKVSSGSNAGSMYGGGSNIVSDWIASWENGPLFLYKIGRGSYNSGLVKGYITEDGQNYICRTDVGLNNGTLNYGFGVMVNKNGVPNNVEYFSKYGITITDSTYLQESQSMLPVEIVDNVKADIIQDKINNISDMMTKSGLNLSLNEIHALCGVAYQFGDAGANFPLFIQLYKKYGNSEELKEQYYSQGGTYVFKRVQGGTNTEGIDRAAANWGLFHDGIYYSGAGGTLDKNSYNGTSSSGNNTTVAPSNDPVEVSGNGVKEQCWNFLTQTMGYSDVVAAGVMGNIQNESTFNPSADNGTHYRTLSMEPYILSASKRSRFARTI